MRAFWDPVQARHAPRFFLQRGQVRPNVEVPAHAEALLAGCGALGLKPEPPPAAWAQVPGAGPEMVPNIHPSPELPAAIVQEGGYTLETLPGLLARFLGPWR